MLILVEVLPFSLVLVSGHNKKRGKYITWEKIIIWNVEKHAFSIKRVSLILVTMNLNSSAFLTEISLPFKCLILNKA